MPNRFGEWTKSLSPIGPGIAGVYVHQLPIDRFGHHRPAVTQGERESVQPVLLAVDVNAAETAPSPLAPLIRPLSQSDPSPPLVKSLRQQASF